MINNKWSEDDFPSDNLPSGIFPNVQLPKQQLPEGQVRPSKAPLSVMGGPPSTKLTVRSVVICTTLTEDIVGFTGEWAESCGYDRLGMLPLEKLHIWEVATWEKPLWKAPNIV